MISVAIRFPRGINGDLLAQNFDFRHSTAIPNSINVASALEDITTFYTAYWGYSWDPAYTKGNNFPHIDWTVTDPDTTNPYYNVYKNGSLYLSNQDWTSGQELHVFIGPIEYEHTNMTIIAYDGQGNSVSDTVIINSRDEDIPWVDFLLWIGILAIFAVIIVSLYLWQRKKQTKFSRDAKSQKTSTLASPPRIPRQPSNVEVGASTRMAYTAPPTPAIRVAPPINGGARVIVQRQFEYVGGKVRVKAKVTNATLQGILRLRIALDVPNSFHLLRIEPNEYEHEGSTVKLNDLLPKEEKAVAWVLEPLICGMESIGGTTSGVDATGTPFALPMAPLEVQVRCPLFARPEEINLPTVQRMIGDLAVKSERVFYLPPGLAPGDALEVAKTVISARDVRFVGTFASSQAAGAFDESAWFYGTTKVGQKRYILTASVSEKDQAIRIFTACDDEAGCTGFLAEAGAAIRRELVQRGAVDSEEKVKELVCEKCGGNLPRAPTIGQDIQCPECRWIWRVTDVFR